MSIILWNLASVQLTRALTFSNHNTVSFFCFKQNVEDYPLSSCKRSDFTSILTPDNQLTNSKRLFSQTLKAVLLSDKVPQPWKHKAGCQIISSELRQGASSFQNMRPFLNSFIAQSLRIGGQLINTRLSFSQRAYLHCGAEQLWTEHCTSWKRICRPGC